MTDSSLSGGIHIYSNDVGQLNVYLEMSPLQLFIFAVLCVVVVSSEWLVRNTKMRHFGTALLVILITAVVANLGIIPTSSTAEAPVPIYDFIFSTLAPLSIFWLLLKVKIDELIIFCRQMNSLMKVGR